MVGDGKKSPPHDGDCTSHTVAAFFTYPDRVSGVPHPGRGN